MTTFLTFMAKLWPKEMTPSYMKENATTLTVEDFRDDPATCVNILKNFGFDELNWNVSHGVGSDRHTGHMEILTTPKPHRHARAVWAPGRRLGRCWTGSSRRAL